MKLTYKNKKGFTLVELLAVIVVLAIIITIAIVSVTGQIRKARENSFIEKCYQYIKAAEYHEVADDPQNPYMYVFPDDTTLSLKEKPDAGYIYRNDEHQYKLRIWDNKLKKCAEKDFDQEKISISNNLDTQAKCTALDGLDMPVDESQLADNQYQIVYYIDYPDSMVNIVSVVNRNSTISLKSLPSGDSGRIAIGWTTKSDGTGHFYSFNASVNNPTDKKTFYLYRKVVKYDLTQLCSTNYIYSTLTSVCTSNLTYTPPDDVICRRAIVLHKEPCRKSGSQYCAKLHSDTITYGRCGNPQSLNVGDAFTCDVNGDGEFDEYNERFYYVSRYFDTTTRSFDNSTAVLIYYNNVRQGVACNRGDLNGYNEGVEYSINLTVPDIASKQLPTTSQWPNVSLKENNRNILDLNARPSYDSPFSYGDYAARLLTSFELAQFCGIGNITNPNANLTQCIFTMENTRFASDFPLLEGFFLENIEGYSNVYGTNAQTVGFSSKNVRDKYGVRPVIEVPINKIDY